MAERLVPVEPGLAKALEDQEKMLGIQGDVAQAQNTGGSLGGKVPGPTAPNPANPPRFPKVESAMREGAMPLATALTGLIPGSLPIQSAIGAGGEALSQMASDKPMDWGQVGVAAATPPAARGLMAGGKMVGRTLGKIVGKSGMVEAGVQKLEGALGADKASADALMEAGKASKLAAPTMTKASKSVVDNIQKYKRLGGADNLVNEAETIARDSAAAAGTGKPWTYGEWFEKAKMLNEVGGKAHVSNTEAAGIRDIRAGILDDLGKADPLAAKAVTAYRRQAGIEDLSAALKKGNPIKEVGALLDDKLVGGIMSAGEKNTAKVIAAHVGPEGLGKTLMALGALGGAGYAAGGLPGLGAAGIPHVLGAIISNPSGGAIARSLIGPSGAVNKAVIPALAQLVRGYMAEQAGEEGQ